MITRRHLIGVVGGGAIMSAFAGPGIASAAGPTAPMFYAICDLKLSGGRALRAAAHAAGCGVVDPAGEIVRLFHGEGAAWLKAGVPLVGYTSWSDYHMMGEVARSAGLRIAQSAIVGGTGACRELVAAQADEMTARMRALLDSTVRTCGDSGIIWIVQA